MKVSTSGKVFNEPSSLYRSSTDCAASLKANQSYGKLFTDAFTPSRGDLIFGLSSIIRGEERYSSCTPLRLIESLFIALNFISEKPDFYTYTGMVNNEKLNVFKTLNEYIERTENTNVDGGRYPLSEVMSRLINTLNKEHLKQRVGVESKHAKFAINAILREDETALLNIPGIKDDNIALDYLARFAAHMESIERELHDFNADIARLFSTSSNTFTRNTLDNLFENLGDHPCYAPSYSLLEAVNDKAEFPDKNDQMRAVEFTNRILSRMIKGVIDGFIKQVSENIPLQKQQNDNAQLHFFLDDIKMEDVVCKSDSKMNGMTAIELRHLYRCRAQLADVVTFYKDKKSVPAPWEKKPELWSRYLPSTEPVLDYIALDSGSLRNSFLSLV